MIFKRSNVLLLVSFLLSLLAFTPLSAQTENDHEAKKDEKFDASKEIMGHVADSHEWHFFGISGHHFTLPLPVIVYVQGEGMKVFSSSVFEDWHVSEVNPKLQISNSHAGLHLERGMKEKLISDNGSKVYDFSITKNVLSMIIGVILLLYIMTAVAKKYKKNGTMTAPTGSRMP